MDFLKDLGIISTGLAVGGAFLAMGWKADGLISKQASNDLSSYLLNPKREQSIKTAYLWPQVFIEFFDLIFGKKHLSFKCFFRSSIATFIAAIICGAVLLILHENSLVEGQENFFLSFISNEIPELLLAVFIFNVFPDYISLLETRIVIGKIKKTKSTIVQCIWVVFDIVATYFIFMIAMVIATNFIFYGEFFDLFENNILPIVMVISSDFVSLPSFLFEFATKPVPWGEWSFLAILVWTTFFTSAWVWLYVASQIVTRLVSPLRKSVRFILYILPVDTKPLQSVCTVMAVLSCLVTWVILAPFELVSLF